MAEVYTASSISDTYAARGRATSGAGPGSRRTSPCHRYAGTPSALQSPRPAKLRQARDSHYVLRRACTFRPRATEQAAGALLTVGCD